MEVFPWLDRKMVCKPNYIYSNSVLGVANVSDRGLSSDSTSASIVSYPPALASDNLSPSVSPIAPPHSPQPLHASHFSVHFHPRVLLLRCTHLQRLFPLQLIWLTLSLLMSALIRLENSLLPIIHMFFSTVPHLLLLFEKKQIRTV